MIDTRPCHTCGFRKRASSQIYCLSCSRMHKANRKNGIYLRRCRDKNGLTKTEAKVLRLLFKFRTLKEIARHLKVSPFAIYHHRRALSLRTGCKTYFHLAVWAERRGYGK